jgi:poly-gamma-glutamate synthesis protein (capsule biosynthesis protein)
VSTSEPASIGLLGDVMLGRGVAVTLARRPPESVWEPELRELAGSLDLLVCNLECCISARGTRTARIPGKPLFFRAPPEAVGALRAIGMGVAGLANNHALDFGEDALGDTLASLWAARIETAGAGRGLDAARRVAVVPAAGRRVGVVAVTDHPSEYAATHGGGGVAYANLHGEPPEWLLDSIAEARSRCDAVVVFPHWGPNMAVRPAYWQRRLAARMQEAGADVVAGHSAHVFHGVGWARGPVLYDLGDALDDYRVEPHLRNDLGVLAIWRLDGAAEIELIGLRLGYSRTGLAHGPDAEWIAARLQRACSELGTAVRRTGEQRFRVSPP